MKADSLSTARIQSLRPTWLKSVSFGIAIDLILFAALFLVFIAFGCGDQAKCRDPQYFVTTYFNRFEALIITVLTLVPTLPLLTLAVRSASFQFSAGRRTIIFPIAAVMCCASILAVAIYMLRNSYFEEDSSDFDIPGTRVRSFSLFAWHVILMSTPFAIVATLLTVLVLRLLLRGTNQNNREL